MVRYAIPSITPFLYSCLLHLEYEVSSLRYNLSYHGEWLRELSFIFNSELGYQGYILTASGKHG